MKKANLIIGLILTAVLVCSQTLTVLAAPAPDSTSPITGIVTYVELVADNNTGVTIVFVTVEDDTGIRQTVHISLETAVLLTPPLIYNDGEQYIIVQPLPNYIEIDPETIIADEQPHPIGSALATFFSDEAEGSDYQTLYDAIMTAHENGNGYGLIAQALWMMEKVAGNTQDFARLLDIKNEGNYSAVTWSDGSPVTLPDGTMPTNWGQFKKAILNGDKKANLGAIVSHQDENAASNANVNHGNGNSGYNRNNTGRGNGNGNGHGNRP